MTMTLRFLVLLSFDFFDFLVRGRGNGEVGAEEEEHEKSMKDMLEGGGERYQAKGSVSTAAYKVVVDIVEIEKRLVFADLGIIWVGVLQNAIERRPDPENARELGIIQKKCELDSRGLSNS